MFASATNRSRWQQRWQSIGWPMAGVMLLLCSCSLGILFMGYADLTTTGGWLSVALIPLVFALVYSWTGDQDFSDCIFGAILLLLPFFLWQWYRGNISDSDLQLYSSAILLPLVIWLFLSVGAAHWIDGVVPLRKALTEWRRNHLLFGMRSLTEHLVFCFIVGAFTILITSSLVLLPSWIACLSAEPQIYHARVTENRHPIDSDGDGGERECFLFSSRYVWELEIDGLGKYHGCTHYQANIGDRVEVSVRHNRFVSMVQFVRRIPEQSW